MRIPRLRFLSCISIGGCALLFLLSAHPVFARERPCGNPFDCLVPAPTLIQPTFEKRFYSPRSVLITGLSWNQTKVDVYIDGVYNGRATLRTDPSDIGNFFYRPFLPLTPGTHSVYTVARNLSEKERSPESPEVSFVVPAPKPATVLLPEGTRPKVSSISTTTEPEAVNNQNANSVLDWFFNKQNNPLATTASSTMPFFGTDLGRELMVLLGIAGLSYAGFYFFKPRYEEPLPYDEEKKDQGPPDGS